MPQPNIFQIDWDKFEWLLKHPNTRIGIYDGRDWFVVVDSVCKSLKKGLCSDYENRPHVCKDFTPGECLGYGKSKLKIYSTIKELQKDFGFLTNIP